MTTSAAANYAEARESVSTRDYVFKMKICVKELREALVWLGVAKRAGFKQKDLDELITECGELIAISVACNPTREGELILPFTLHPSPLIPFIHPSLPSSRSSFLLHPHAHAYEHHSAWLI